jgi:hypothetical protein
LPGLKWGTRFSGCARSRPTRIAAHARRAPVDREAAEAADLDAVAPHQCVAHGVEDGLDGVLGVAVGELAETGGQFFDEVGSGHVFVASHPGPA